MCSQMLMHAIAHGGWMDTVRESALEVDAGRKNSLLRLRLEAESVLWLAFQRDALPTDLSPPHCPVVRCHETESCKKTGLLS